MQPDLHDMLTDPAFALLQRGVLHYVALSVPEREVFTAWLEDGRKPAPEPRAIPPDVVEQRLAALDMLRKKYADYDDEAWRRWLQHKAEETALLAAIETAQQTGDATILRLHNEMLYGALDTNLVYGCLHLAFRETKRLKRDPAVAEELYAQLNRPLIDSEAVMHLPSPEIFAHYKTLAIDFFADQLSLLNALPERTDMVVEGEEIAAVLQRMIATYGEAASEWQVRYHARVDRVSINPQNKRVYVANREFHLSPARLRGLLLHEVGVHVGRRLGKTGFAAEVPAFTYEQRMREEGLGVVIEQLCLKRYHGLRLYRYIALGLANGVIGEPRNAREVYELLWRLRYSASRSTVERAQRFAAFETMRVFRGVAPVLAGAALTRDKVYVEGADYWWRILSEKQLSATEFAAILSGFETERKAA